jgi:predicted GIY-YIG superfamily endonuclease
MSASRDYRRYFIYRIFDKEDQLLYIGYSTQPENRIGLHSALSSQSPTSWEISRRMARYSIEEFKTKELARAAERRAIEEEAPLLNHQHNPKRFVRVAGRYQPLENARQ